MITEKIAYRVGEVYLADWAGRPDLLEVVDVASGAIRHQYAWEYAKDWQKRKPVYYGRFEPVLFLGFKVGRRLDRSPRV